MIRKIIKINTALCNGCGACAKACHENAIGMENGKAVLLREDYCDGLGDCLPTCPTGAITFEQREAPAYNEAAVQENKKAKQHHGCPGNRPFFHKESDCSQLRQWPVQIKLAPVKASFYDQSDLLISADCAAYACGSFHEDFMKDHITLIACPKLDACDYSEKLTELFRLNDIKSITVARMEVPCCGGLSYAVQQAIKNSGKAITCRIVTLSTTGALLHQESL